ncbi:acyltransferase family protein [Spirosoma pulveris]
MNVLEKSPAIVHRSAGADILKAWSIFAVVFIHGSSLIPYPPSFVNATTIVFRFCVPIFIFFWAYFSERSIIRKGNPGLYLSKRFNKLLIPFLFWSTIYFFLNADFKILTFTKALTMHWLGYGWSGQYYFIILFQLILAYIGIRYFKKYFVNHPGIIILLSILFYSLLTYSSFLTIGSITKIGDRLFIYWLPYLLLGITYAARGFSKKLFLPLILGLLTPLLIPLEVYLSHQGTEPQFVYMLPSVFIASLLLVYVFMNSELNFNVSNSSTSFLINIISKNTMGIFCLNPLVVATLSAILPSLHTPLTFWGSFIILPFLSTFLAMSACLLIIYLLKRINLGVLVDN